MSESAEINEALRAMENNIVERREAFVEKLNAQEARLNHLEVALAANTTITLEIKRDTGEFLEIFHAMRGGFKVLGWIGVIAKWAISISIPLIGLYWAIKNGPGPLPGIK